MKEIREKRIGDKPFFKKLMISSYTSSTTCNACLCVVKRNEESAMRRVTARFYRRFDVFLIMVLFIVGLWKGKV